MIYSSFNLDREELIKISDFIKNHDCSIPLDKYGYKDVGASGGDITYYFTPTSLGIVTTISCVCGKKIDVTEYENW